jgi:ferredoxin--NADP+ reductase
MEWAYTVPKSFLWGAKVQADEKHFRARVTQRVDVAPDLWSIRIDADGVFAFAPGQYATLGLQGSDRRWERAYSIASAPHEREIEFFVELVPHGELTPQLYDLQVGDQLLMRKVPKGRFTLETSKPGRTNHLLVSTVTGVAPFVSYVRAHAKAWREGTFPPGHKLFLLNGASRSWEFGYRNELEAIAKEMPWLEYVATISRPWEDANWTGEVGRVDDLLRKYVDQWGLNSQNSIAYLCGHPQMIEHSKGILHRIGFQKDFMKEEVYWVPSRDSSVGRSQAAGL